VLVPTSKTYRYRSPGGLVPDNVMDFMTDLQARTGRQRRLDTGGRRFQRALAGCLVLCALGGAAGAQSAFESDDFNVCGGVDARWSVVDPLGQSTVTITGAGTDDAKLAIDVPAGLSADAWNINLAPRVMEPCADQDFVLELKLDSLPSQKYQFAGVLVEQDADHWLRFDFYSDGNRLWSFAGKTQAGQSTPVRRTAGPTGLPLYLRVTRAGDTWTHEFSGDGQSWTVNQVFDFPLFVSAIGPFAGNAGPAPAFHAEFDYLLDTADPFGVEDGNPAGPASTLDTALSGAGSGTILRVPDQPTYSCGQQVTVHALPDPGSEFGGWAGALQGFDNPAVLTISSDGALTANFSPSGPPQITGLAIAPSAFGARVTWQTNKPATSRVDYGTTVAYGANAAETNLVFSHEVDLVGLLPATAYHLAATSVDGGGLSTTTGDTTFQTVLSVGPQPDDFNRCAGLAGYWSIVDPLGGASVQTVGAGTSDAHVRIALPTGVKRDAWGNNTTTRIMQAADDEDFELEVSFDSVVETAYQMQGLLIEQDADHWLRFDFYSNGTTTRIFAASTTAGQTSFIGRLVVTPGVPLRLRVDRSGDHWVQSWSDDAGQSWTAALDFDHALAVHEVGIFAGSAGASPPAFTLEADYFWRTTQAIPGEDGAPVGGPFFVTTANTGIGFGSITVDPVATDYACGEVVTVTATADPGSSFSGWEGELAGESNPAVVPLGGDLDVVARFDSAAPPIITDVVISATTSSALITWTTDKPASSTVDFGLTPSLGSQQTDVALVTDHALSVTGLADGALYHYTLTSTDGQSQVTTTAPDSFATPPSVGPQSDDFNRCAGVADHWIVIDPVGGAQVDLQGVATAEATLVIDLPAGSSRDVWGTNLATRLVQPADNEDFELEVSFTGLLDTGFQMQGLLVEQDADDWLRFDFYSDGTDTHIFAARTIAGSSSALFNDVIPGGVPLKMRVQRVGDNFIQRWSSDDGATWFPGANFVHALNVSDVGIFAGVAGAHPALTVTVDYFFDLSAPVVLEDGPIDAGPFTIDIPGDGSVVIDPPLAQYGCGTEVTIQVVPVPGTIFTGWSGDLAGFGSTFTLHVGSDLVLQPLFAPTPAPLIQDLSTASGATSTLVTWATDVPADSVVEYGLSTSYGSVTSDTDMIVGHWLLLTGLVADTTYHFRVTSSSDGGLSTTTDDGVFTTKPPGSSLSSDFNRRNLDVSRFSFQDPRDDSLLRVEGAGTADALLVIEVPAGQTHDIWTENNSARALQLIEDEDLDVAVKLESAFDSAYQMQGLLFVGENDDDFVRIEYHHDGQGLRVFAATTLAGLPQARLDLPVWTGPWAVAPLYLRVKRAGDTWTVYHAFTLDETDPADEASWSTVGSFVYATSLTAVGPFVGNAGNAPAHLGRFDWIFEVLDPVLSEDLALPADLDAPYIYRDSVVVHGATSAEVSWLTDETATGSVQFGLTTSYELGELVALNPQYDQQITLSQLQAQTTYHYRIFANDGAQSTVGSDRTFTTTEPGGGGPGPVISLWYASELLDGTYYQRFGHNGLAQKFCNILGNACDSNAPMRSLDYSLNGGPLISLSMGPDARRLLRPGDFNIDLSIEDLLEGDNDLLLIAEDTNGDITQLVMTVNYVADNISTISGVIDWDAVSSLDEVAQVVDGKWATEAGKLRIIEQGYDRFIGFGDHRWKDFEIEVPVIVRSVDPGGFVFPSNYPLVGFALRWPGHAPSGTQPSWRFWPMGALASFRWDTLSSTGFCELRGNFNTAFSNVQCQFQNGVEYVLKARVTTNPDGSTDYRYKHWPSAESEPNWIVEFTLPAGDPEDPDGNPAAGSIGLLAHHVDAEFGDVQIQRFDLP